MARNLASIAESGAEVDGAQARMRTMLGQARAAVGQGAATRGHEVTAELELCISDPNSRGVWGKAEHSYVLSYTEESRNRLEARSVKKVENGAGLRLVYTFEGSAKRDALLGGVGHPVEDFPFSFQGGSVCIQMEARVPADDKSLDRLGIKVMAVVSADAVKSRLEAELRVGSAGALAQAVLKVWSVQVRQKAGPQRTEFVAVVKPLARDAHWGAGGAGLRGRHSAEGLRGVAKKCEWRCGASRRRETTILEKDDWECVSCREWVGRQRAALVGHRSLTRWVEDAAHGHTELHAGQYARARNPPPVKGVDGPCWDHGRGNCWRGDSCRFSHGAPGGGEQGGDAGAAATGGAAGGDGGTRGGMAAVGGAAPAPAEAQQASGANCDGQRRGAASLGAWRTGDGKAAATPQGVQGVEAGEEGEVAS